MQTAVAFELHPCPATPNSHEPYNPQGDKSKISRRNRKRLFWVYSMSRGIGAKISKRQINPNIVPYFLDYPRSVSPPAQHRTICVRMGRKGSMGNLSGDKPWLPPHSSISRGPQTLCSPLPFQRDHNGLFKFHVKPQKSYIYNPSKRNIYQ